MVVYSRPLRYHNRTQHPLLTGEEKGIDVRIALNVIALAHHREGDHLKRFRSSKPTILYPPRSLSAEIVTEPSLDVTSAVQSSDTLTGNSSIVIGVFEYVRR